jgi:hypothetical protein
MKMRIWNERLCKLQMFLQRLSHFFRLNFGQMNNVHLEYPESICMSLQSPFSRSAVVFFRLGMFLVLAATVSAQTNYYATNGTEYAITGSLPGDQVYPDVALNSSGGFLVWQDNATVNGNWAVRATRVDSTLSATTWLDEQVNGSQDTNNEENARVALLKNGGAVFVWQGGVEGVNQHIYARFLNSTNTFLTTTDVLVNTFTQNYQVYPAVAVLNNSNVVVVWSSFDEVSTNSMFDVYGQILSPTGQKIGGEFLINQFTAYNQRNPAVAALANGGFVVAWISEQERAVAPNWGNNTTLIAASATPAISVDVYARLYNSNGVAVVNGLGTTNEFLVNADYNPCANPAVAAGSDGGFMITWCARDTVNFANGWDIHACPFSSAGAAGTVVTVNSYTYGDQYVPRISSIGTDYLIVWTSLGEDGSREGVYGQFLHDSGTNSTFTGSQFLVNTTTIGSQMEPAVASDGESQFLAVWTSFTGIQYGFDLYGQRYINVGDVLFPMSAPNVWAPFTLSNNVYLPQLVVSWPLLQSQGITVSNYQVFMNGATSPTAIVPANSNSWTATGLSAATTYSFAVNYVAASGTSPLSPSATGTTWQDCDYYGVPCQWLEQYYGYNIGSWPSGTAPLAPGGPTLLQVFMTGGNPTNSATWLTSTLTLTSQGMELVWNTQPGLTYQVQESTNMATWSNVGTPIYAAGTNNFIPVGGQPASFYRIQCVNP